MAAPDREHRVSLALTEDEVGLLQMGLVRYLMFWQQHYGEDGGQTHSAADYEQITTNAGRLLWRLEEALSEGHSEWAVPPASGDR